MEDESTYNHLFPIAVEVQQGQKYYWCGCNESKNQPFCDKKCKGISLCYLAELTEEVFFCNCKQTKSPPLCDGSHAKLLLEHIKKRQQK